MQSINFGDRAKAVTIDRANCADNVLGRAVLLDPNPAVKNIAWPSTFKDGKEVRRGVEVTQEQAVELRVIPRVTYFFLIARLNTDMKGNVFGDDIKVEYLQLAANVYEDFCESAAELQGFTSITLKKKVRKPGDQYGYVVPKASQHPVSKEVMDKIQKMRDTEGLISAMWQMVDVTTSITFEDWKKIVADSDGVSSISQPGILQKKEQPALQASTEVQNQFSEGDFDNDFGDDNDFN